MHPFSSQLGTGLAPTEVLTAGFSIGWASACSYCRAAPPDSVVIPLDDLTLPPQTGLSNYNLVYLALLLAPGEVGPFVLAKLHHVAIMRSSDEEGRCQYGCAICGLSTFQ